MSQPYRKNGFGRKIEETIENSDDSFLDRCYCAMLEYSKQLYTKEREIAEGHKERLRQRMGEYGFEEKKPIAGDGSCQFAAFGDQLNGDPSNAADYRRAAVHWLRENAETELPNGSKIKDFIFFVENDEANIVEAENQEERFNRYCVELDDSNTWGNHLTLVALAERFKVRIFVLSSAPGELHFVIIQPQSGPFTQTLYLSHLSEYHYGSLRYTEDLL